MKKLFCLLFFLLTTGFANVSLKDLLAEAQPGSYFVTEQNKTFTFVHIQNNDHRSIVIEEVTIPAASFLRQPMNWKQWFECGAPGHTSWTMSQINLENGRFEETFSFTHQGWIDMSETNPFMSTLLNLSFKQVPETERRRVGMPPGHGRIDRRPIWNPRLVVDGQKMGYIPFTAWRTRWPNDGSELSRKYIEVYLPSKTENASIPDYPTYFPFWLEVEGKIGSAKVRVIDSGMSVTSPKESIPLRPFSLLGDAQLHPDGLTFYLKAPSYYSQFILLADEIDSSFAQIFSLPCEMTRLENHMIALKVPKEELEKSLKVGKEYIFMISSNDSTLETRKPLLYKQL